MSRSRRAFWNYGTSFIFTAVTMVTGLFARPLLVRWLGDERFGAAKMISDWGSYLNLFELGLSGALAPLLARALAHQDRDALYGTMATGTRVFFRIAAAAILVGLVLTPLITFVVPVQPGIRWEVRLAWVVGLLTFLSFALIPFKLLGEAQQLGYRNNILITAQALVIVGSSLLFARAGFGVTGQSLAVVLGVLPMSAATAFWATRRFPGVIRASVTTRPDAENWHALRKLGVPTLIINISGRMGLLSDNLIAGNVLGPAKVTQLDNTQRLGVIAQLQLLGIGSASWAGMAELHATGQRELFNRRVVELSRLVALLGVAGLVPIAAFNRHFYALWGVESPYGGDVVIIVSALNALLIALMSFWGWCFSGTGKMALLVPNAVIGVVINLTASIAFAHRFGIVGPLLGTTISFLGFQTWYLLHLLRRTFGLRLTALASAILTPIAWGIPYAGALWWLSQTHPPTGWLDLAAKMGGSTLAYLGLTFFLILRPHERAAWALRLRTLLPGRVTAAD